MKYNIELVEILNRIITVEAPTAGLAQGRVEQAYNDEEIVLDSNDMVEPAKFNIMEDEPPDDFSVDYIVK